MTLTVNKRAHVELLISAINEMLRSYDAKHLGFSYTIDRDDIYTFGLVVEGTTELNQIYGNTRYTVDDLLVELHSIETTLHLIDNLVDSKLDMK